MSTVINLYGGPGTGKSTTAAATFAHLKHSGLNAELVSEYVKQWAWEGRKPTAMDQFYFFAKQARREYTLFGRADYIVTDSPVPLCGLYGMKFGTPQQGRLMAEMVRTYLDMAEASGQLYVHVFLKRVKPYVQAGRFQSEEEARSIDGEVRQYLVDMGLPFEEVTADDEAHLDVVYTTLRSRLTNG